MITCKAVETLRETERGSAARAREELAGPCLAGAVQCHVAGPSPRCSGETKREVSCRLREELVRQHFSVILLGPVQEAQGNVVSLGPVQEALQTD